MTGPRNQEIDTTRKRIVTVQGEGSHKAYLTARMFQDQAAPFVVILPDRKQALGFMEDLDFFMPREKERVIYFPGYPLLPFKSLSFHREISSQRLGALSKIQESRNQKFILITHVDPLLQQLISQETLNRYAELIISNEEIDREALVLKLEAGGYTRVSLVEDPGEYSVRGGILDLFSPNASKPVRMEFFGEMVDSLRLFSPYTQRTTKELQEFIILPATEAVIFTEDLPLIFARLRHAGSQAGLDANQVRGYVNETRESGRLPGIESMLSLVYDRLDSLFDYLSPQTVFILDSPELLAAKALEFQNTAWINFKHQTGENRLCVAPESIYLNWDQATRAMDRFDQIAFQQLLLEPDRGTDATTIPTRVPFDYQDNQALSFRLQRQGRVENPLTPLIDWVETHAHQQRVILFVLSQKAQAKRLISLVAPYGIALTPCDSFHAVKDLSPGVYYLVGTLSSGFVLPGEGLALVTENEIFGKKRVRRQKAHRQDLVTGFIAPEELKNGDFIVHMEHGVGRYEGLCNLTINHISQDFILIVYQDEDKLYLPVDRMEMIGKYIGVDGYTPVLDKIGSKNWIKSKASAKAEVEKLAADLLDLYAMRKVNTGFAFSLPDNYYNDFEASFPYEETRDQLKAIDDVHLDMESPVPMDRLVCGDVGYGKTEVAIRAAFKAVNDGKQVAVVVPTTILAEQHLATFRERFKNYPVLVECLSRFRNRKEQKEILKRLKAGQVDIVIGTHRLLQKDVEFSALGLVVLDEEQRFGVKHKEILKKKRNTVDVLALTATPIPRTLHMSLTGMRDISVITTPPADRQPIVSYISKYSDSIIKEAVEKELAREGQVFFVHNNISSIFKIADQIQKIVPHARVGVAHGRLSETELEKVMFQFVNFEINVLVCTTIIESGLDIPSANTMIIDKAERFGLAQIYQLRGRIGRGDHQAYAYLFVSDEAVLTKDAKKRLSALMEHRDLGSGFQIAMKDLQIRGAGTALGASQSGHIAAVGYDMFLKLLDQAVHDLKGEHQLEPLDPEINAAMSSGFPDHYIESVEQRLTLYRRLSRLTTVADISDMKRELTDRYGKLPSEAENMLLKIMLRIYAIRAGVQRLDITPTSLTLVFSPAHLKRPLPSIDSILKTIAPYKFIKKESVQIQLENTRNNISKALLETKLILTALG